MEARHVFVEDPVAMKRRSEPTVQGDVRLDEELDILFKQARNYDRLANAQDPMSERRRGRLAPALRAANAALTAGLAKE